MTIDQLRKRVADAHIPDIAKITGVPVRTLYRFAQTGMVPKHETVVKLEKWARR